MIFPGFVLDLFEIKDYRKFMKNQEAGSPFITFGRGPTWIHGIAKKKRPKVVDLEEKKVNISISSGNPSVCFMLTCIN